MTMLRWCLWSGESGGGGSVGLWGVSARKSGRHDDLCIPFGGPARKSVGMDQSNAGRQFGGVGVGDRLGHGQHARHSSTQQLPGQPCPGLGRRVLDGGFRCLCGGWGSPRPPPRRSSPAPPATAWAPTARRPSPNGRTRPSTRAAEDSPRARRATPRRRVRRRRRRRTARPRLGRHQGTGTRNGPIPPTRCDVPPAGRLFLHAQVQLVQQPGQFRDLPRVPVRQPPRIPSPPSVPYPPHP